MNDACRELLLDVVGRVQRAVRERDCPAVVALEGHRTVVMEEYDYLRDDETATAFEHRAAEQARGIAVQRFAFAVSQVWLIVEEGVAARAVSNLPLRQGEHEVITWMTYDAGDGVDYGLVPVGRRPNGEPVFGDPEVFEVPVQARATMPGRTLLALLTGAEDA
ncbi:hypothetical protein [Streptantibioticus silvisoli]|uniref:Uncharacterized protein n=1 Tax=Streptantibioticus silvisoli TaxID=2705255 RepID=A0ABT6W2Z1_9ACTN|nr:hypothetical protein [Streptantibioticus silvisoli]MDI5964053.1 hypothetical protein [Streptantibioticus silvisoli]